ncbi:MAG: methyl-accepting chemotaxis protein [Desulfuromonadaceae bacterium]
MSNSPYSSVAAVRIRMVAFSLIASGVIGGIAVAAGSFASVFAVAIVTALFCSLLCAWIFQRLMSEIGLDHGLERSSAHAQSDDSASLCSPCDLATKALESRQKERKELLEQIFTAQETLKVTMHNWSTGDEKETARVRDAVTAMERLNNAFSRVIAEIDELSGRTEERASISTQMSATTDTIAENINQYSTFVIETSRSIEEMARATRETAENIRALSTSTEQTVYSINTISRSQSTVRDNSERSASASESVRTLAQHGLRSMAATMKAMQEIEKSNDESFESINRLSRHSARVGEFLSVIQEVVEQTNLLSLNASIIAAQAGSRGRAFAVVAEEVRSLARRTSASTREIEELVRNIQKETSCVHRSVTQGKEKVKEGVTISGVANEALVAIDKSAEDAFKMVSSIAVETTEQAVNIQRITEEAEKNLERVQQVTLATEHQQQGSSQIVKNLEHMRELAHRINSSAQEQAKGNRLYLKSVMDDNERTKELKNEAAQHIALAHQAVEAVSGVEVQIATNAIESKVITEGLASLTCLIDRYRGEAIPELDEGTANYE